MFGVKSIVFHFFCSSKDDKVCGVVDCPKKAVYECFVRYCWN